jgi:hypothetical protein
MGGGHSQNAALESAIAHPRPLILRMSSHWALPYTLHSPFFVLSGIFFSKHIKGGFKSEVCIVVTNQC